MFVFAGAGIHVFIGVGGSSSQPNNGLLVSNDPGSGRRFRFFCRSDSTMVGVGELIGLDGSPIMTSNVFGFEAPQDGGELRVENSVGIQSALTDNEQGVYTCRIPLQNQTVRKVNIGVYPNGFNSELFLYIQMYAHGASRMGLFLVSFPSLSCTNE